MQDGILPLLLPPAVYAALVLQPKARGPKVTKIAIGVAVVLLLGAIVAAGSAGPSFDAAFDAIVGLGLASALLGAALGALAYFRIVRDRAHSWLWRGAGLVLAVGAAVAVFVLLALALDM